VRLAVLIPAYNAGPDLAVTLASLDSEEGEFDVVVVDDGSVPPVDLSGRPLAATDHQSSTTGLGKLK
jgi:cellulose synthase/poly-beta-1,6-N-acetylglucosamine synthase-like glycosyltransferase